MALVKGSQSLYLMRLLLGAAEAGFFPGVVLYLTYWFPAHYRARVIAALYVAVPISNAAAALISSALLELNGSLGPKGWQGVFVGEAVPAVVLGVLVLRLLADRPLRANWLRPEQRDWLEAELQAERMQVERNGCLGTLQALTDMRVLILAVVWMLSLVPTYGITFFMPQVVKSPGPSNAL